MNTTDTDGSAELIAAGAPTVPPDAVTPGTADYASAADFTDDSFWAKLRQFAGVAGRQVVEKALWLYFATQAETCPTWAKTTAYGALAYFILPADAVPDILPGVGYVDDLGALAAAVSIIASQITPEVKQKTAETLDRWFPPKRA